MSLCLGIAGYLAFRHFPDLDIRILGIGRHRHFLFHSALLPLVALVWSRRNGSDGMAVRLVRAFLAGMCAGIGFHLLLDVFQTKAVMFPFVGSLVDGVSWDDRLWEGTHAAVSLGIGGWLARGVRA